MPEAAHGEPGHNVGGIAADRLVSIIERHERLEEEVKGLRADQKDIMTEAVSAGFDAKIIRQVIRLRRMSADDLQEQDTLLALYRQAAGI